MPTERADCGHWLRTGRTAVERIFLTVVRMRLTGGTAQEADVKNLLKCPTFATYQGTVPT